jgi:uroporphyrinogen decarboxylase
MDSYERIKASVDHQTPDRVPCDYSAEKEVTQALCQALQLQDVQALLNVLGIDRRSVGPRYVGPELKKFEDGSYEHIVPGGPVMKDVPSPVGGINASIVRFPWAEIEKPEELDDRPGWTGRLEWWNFSSIAQQIDTLEAQGHYWITTHGDPSGLQHLEMWVGDERFLTLLAAEPELAMAMIEQHNRFRLEHALRTLEAGGGRIHELNGGGDYGSQIGLTISVRMFRKYFKDIYLNFYREIKKHFDVEIFFHSCGAIADLIPELIDVGVTIVDPIQVGAKGMEISSLKARFGDQLTFHGAIDIQQLLPHGTPGQVRQEVHRIISVLGKDGGYILAPTHALQVDIPLENIFTMYETAQGRKIER